MPGKTNVTFTKFFINLLKKKLKKPSFQERTFDNRPVIKFKFRGQRFKQDLLLPTNSKA